jgi:hypothetical protein
VRRACRAVTPVLKVWRKTERRVRSDMVHGVAAWESARVQATRGEKYALQTFTSSVHILIHGSRYAAECMIAHDHGSHD